MSIEKHRHESLGLTVSLCVIVTSDKVIRGIYEDEVVPTAARVASKHGCKLENYSIVPNDREAIAAAIAENLGKCDAIVVSGGTGLGARDISVDVVREICSKDMPGFGELFRYITFQLYGPAALATRAMACVVRDRLVFVTPGSPNAVELALDRLILPEVRHLITELRGLRN